MRLRNQAEGAGPRAGKSEPMPSVAQFSSCLHYSKTLSRQCRAGDARFPSVAPLS